MTKCTLHAPLHAGYVTCCKVTWNILSAGLSRFSISASHAHPVKCFLIFTKLTFYPTLKSSIFAQPLSHLYYINENKSKIKIKCVLPSPRRLLGDMEMPKITYSLNFNLFLLLQTPQTPTTWLYVYLRASHYNGLSSLPPKSTSAWTLVMYFMHCTTTQFESPIWQLLAASLMDPQVSAGSFPTSWDQNIQKNLESADL